MAGGASQYQDEDGGAGIIADINVTPLVDVTLVLLIIFMVTAQLIVEKDRGIQIERPKTVTGAEGKADLSVTIDAQRVVHIDGNVFPDLTVARAFVQQRTAENPDLKAVIAADVGVPHGDVMKVIDLVKRAKVKKFMLASDAQPERDEEGSP
ncbi:MAG TPA: biopolymer transporter ExbD [Kofleriaceae bacterium]|nr:biopolymer transporter ExbD [Kofleriaceae bacterium]